jgi:hypothetical protein
LIFNFLLRFSRDMPTQDCRLTLRDDCPPVMTHQKRLRKRIPYSITKSALPVLRYLHRRLRTYAPPRRAPSLCVLPALRLLRLIIPLVLLRLLPPRALALPAPAPCALRLRPRPRPRCGRRRGRDITRTSTASTSTTVQIAIVRVPLCHTRVPKRPPF